MNRRDGAQQTALLAILAIVVVGALGLIAIFALNLGPFAASSTPTLSTSASGSPSSPPTSEPSSGSPLPSASGPAPATPSPTTRPTPATPEEALLADVPEAIRSTCTVAAGRAPISLIATCSVDAGAIEVSYSAYDSASALADAFTNLRLDSQIEPDTGNCADHATWPAEGTYAASGQPSGRFLCTDEPGAPTIYWTTDTLLILGQASLAADSADYGRLVDFWLNEAGPIL